MERFPLPSDYLEGFTDNSHFDGAPQPAQKNVTTMVSCNMEQSISANIIPFLSDADLNHAVRLDYESRQFEDLLLGKSSSSEFRPASGKKEDRSPKHSTSKPKNTTSPRHLNARRSLSATKHVEDEGSSTINTVIRNNIAASFLQNRPQLTLDAFNVARLPAYENVMVANADSLSSSSNHSHTALQMARQQDVSSLITSPPDLLSDVKTINASASGSRMRRMSSEPSQSAALGQDDPHIGDVIHGKRSSRGELVRRPSQLSIASSERFDEDRFSGVSTPPQQLFMAELASPGIDKDMNFSRLTVSSAESPKKFSAAATRRAAFFPNRRSASVEGEILRADSAPSQRSAAIYPNASGTFDAADHAEYYRSIANKKDPPALPRGVAELPSLANILEGAMNPDLLESILAESIGEAQVGDWQNVYDDIMLDDPTPHQLPNLPYVKTATPPQLVAPLLSQSVMNRGLPISNRTNTLPYSLSSSLPEGVLSPALLRAKRVKQNFPMQQRFRLDNTPQVTRGNVTDDPLLQFDSDVSMQSTRTPQIHMVPNEMPTEMFTLDLLPPPPQPPY